MNIVKLLLSFAILLAFFGLGEAIVRLLGVAFPGSIIGMVLLAVCLVTGVLKVEWVAPSADVLLSYLGMLFVPPAVAVMLYGELIARDWLALTVGTIGSLVAVLWATALTANLLMKKGEGEND